MSKKYFKKNYRACLSTMKDVSSEEEKNQALNHKPEQMNLNRIANQIWPKENESIRLKDPNQPSTSRSAMQQRYVHPIREKISDAIGSDIVAQEITIEEESICCVKEEETKTLLNKILEKVVSEEEQPSSSQKNLHTFNEVFENFIQNSKAPTYEEEEEEEEESSTKESDKNEEEPMDLEMEKVPESSKATKELSQVAIDYKKKSLLRKSLTCAHCQFLAINPQLTAHLCCEGFVTFTNVWDFLMKWQPIQIYLKKNKYFHIQLQAIADSGIIN